MKKRLLTLAAAAIPLAGFASESHLATQDTSVKVPEPSIRIDNTGIHVKPEGCYAFLFRSMGVQYRMLLARYAGNVTISGLTSDHELSFAEDFRIRIVRQAPGYAYVSFRMPNAEDISELLVQSAKGETLEEVAAESYYARSDDLITLSYYEQCPTNPPSRNESL